MKNINKPLSDAEFDELDDFLNSDSVPEESMDISTLDGFFTALVIGSEPVMPSEWMPFVWGETDGDEMIWESQKQAEKYFGYLIRYMNTIATLFQVAPEEFEALTFERKIEDRTILIN